MGATNCEWRSIKKCAIDYKPSARVSTLIDAVKRVSVLSKNEPGFLTHEQWQDVSKIVRTKQSIVCTVNADILTVRRKNIRLLKTGPIHCHFRLIVKTSNGTWSHAYPALHSKLYHPIVNRSLRKTVVVIFHVLLPCITEKRE